MGDPVHSTFHSGSNSRLRFHSGMKLRMKSTFTMAEIVIVCKMRSFECQTPHVLLCDV